MLMLKVNVKTCAYDKIYMNKGLIEHNLYQLIDQFNERKINHRHLSFAVLNNINLFYDGDGITCKMLFYLYLGW